MVERIKDIGTLNTEISNSQLEQSVWRFVDSIAKDDEQRREHIVALSHRFEPAYVATELVRRQRAGFMVGDVRELRTGYQIPWIGTEGYAVSMSPEEILKNSAKFGEALYATTVGKEEDYQRKQRLLLTAQGVTYDISSFIQLNRKLGATLGKMRAQRNIDPEAYDRFRVDTYNDVDWRLRRELQPDHTIFDIELPDMADRSRLPITRVELSGQEQVGLHFLFNTVRSIGNPLARAALHMSTQDNPFAR